MKRTYDWRNVAERTEVVYDSIMGSQSKSLARRVRNHWERGRIAGPLIAILYLFCHYWIIVMTFFEI